MYSISDTYRNDAENFRIGALVSLAFHIALFLYFGLSTINRDYSQPEPIKIILKEIQEPLKHKKQIVTPPDLKPSETEPKEADKLSDKNFVTEKEQIKRGIDPNAGKVVSGKDKPQASERTAEEPVKPEPPQKKAIEQSKPKEQAAQKKQSPKIKTLSLDSNTVFNKFSKDSPTSSRNPNSSQAVQSARPFSRPQGSGAAIIGQAGISDFIPNLPDGDITFLNAKADQFAVFVRRVATRVFGALRTVGWEQIRATDVRSIRTYSTVRAVLDPQGNLLSITLDGESGSHRFDKVLLQASKNARDPNPPPAAAAQDGNFHFVFKSKSWVRIHSGRNGAPVERRWILLATGLL